MNHHQSLFCIAITAALAAPVLAQSPPQKVEPVEVTGSNDSYTPPARATATKTDTPNLLTPQSIAVVPRAVLNEQRAITLTDAVRNVSGVASDFGFNGNAQPLLILRGFPSTSMSAQSSMLGSSTYYLDGNPVKGVPVNMADVQAVEVVKGPASVLYGRSEPGGLVNVVRRPLSANTAFSFDQTIGQYGLSRTVLEGGGALNETRTLLGRANLSYVKDGSPRDFVKNDLAALSATLGWIPTASTAITASFNFNDQRYRTDYGVPVQGTRPITPNDHLQYNDSPEASRTKSNTVAITAEHRFSDAWKAKLRLLTQRADTHEVDVTPYRIDLATGDDCSSAKPPQMCRYYFYARPNGRAKLDQVTLDITGKFDTGALTHSVLATVDSFRDERTGVTYLQTLPSVDFFNPRPSNTPRLDTARAVTDTRDDRSRWTSVTLQDQIALGGGLHAVLALRHDKTAAVYAAKDSARPNEVSLTSPRAGLVYQLSANHSLYAQYQDSLAANNGRNPADGTALAPERAKQIEIGYKAALFDGLVTSTLAAYQLEKRNLADYALRFTQNSIRTTGKARSRGIEWDALGQLSTNVAVIASYAFTDTEVLEDTGNRGKALANAPKYSGSVWARYTMGPWAFGGGVFAQSQRQGDTANTFQLPGYATTDLMASYSFRMGGNRAIVQGNVKNVFNRVYFTGSHQFSSDWVQVGAPRSASVSLRVEF